MHRLLFLLSSFLAFAVAKVSNSDFAKENSQWAVLDKFCFDRDGGTMTISAKGPEFSPEMADKFAGQEIGIYHDLEDGFPSVYDTGLSCKAKRAQAKSVINIQKNRQMSSRTGQKFTVSGIRPRWWWVVLMNCDEEELQLDDFRIHFKNDGGKWSSEFSYDEQGIFEVLVGLLALTLATIIVSCVSFAKLKKLPNNDSYQIMGYLLLALTIYVFSLIFQVAHRDAYSSDGVGLQGFDDFCLFLDQIVQLLLAFIFLAVSKGWVVNPPAHEDDESTFRRTQQKSVKRVVLEVMFMYLVCSILLVWWALSSFDSVLHQYVYQSPPGAVLSVLRIVGLLWFLRNCVTMMKRDMHDSKKPFFKKLILLGIIFFASVPAVAIIAESMDDWARKKFVTAIDNILTFTVMLFLYILANGNAVHFERPKLASMQSEMDGGENAGIFSTAD